MVAYLTIELHNQVVSGVRTCVSHRLELLSPLRRYCSAAATLHLLHYKWREQITCLSQVSVWIILVLPFQFRCFEVLQVH